MVYVERTVVEVLEQGVVLEEGDPPVEPQLEKNPLTVRVGLALARVYAVAGGVWQV